MTTSELQSKIIKVLQANGVEYAALFGSVARGENKPDSDVDILIRYTKTPGLFAHVGLTYELQDRLGRKVDLITEAGLSKHLAPNIKNDLRVLYGQTQRSDLL